MVGTAPNSSTRKEVFNENDYNSAKLGIKGYGVVSGGVATVSGTNMKVTLGYCYYRLGGQTLYIGGTNILLQSTTKDRIYLIGLTNGTWTSQVGTAADPNSTTDGYFERYTPSPPTQIAGYLNIVQVYVPANATVLTSDMLKDMRIMLPDAPPLPMPLEEGKTLTVTGGVPTWQASSSGGSSIPTYLVADFTIADCSRATVGRYKGSYYFKTRHPMLFSNEENLGFIKLYDYTDPHRPVEMRWREEWDNLTDYDLKQGIVKDLTDTIRIINTRPSAFRLIYTENVVPFTPKIITYIARDPTLKPKRCIPYRIATLHSGLQEVVRIVGSVYDYTVTVASSEEYSWSFPDSARVAFFPKDGVLTMQVGGSDSTMRIEVYSHGKSKPQSRIVMSQPMGSTMVPQAVFDKNSMDLTTFPFLTGAYKPRSGNFYFRLRDIETNTVTNFANQRLHIKYCGMRRMTYDNGDAGDLIGRYLRVSLI